MPNLQQEIWTDILLEGFYPKGAFINESRDMSALVENNIINLAEAGVNPEVLIDNTSYPIQASTREDIPHALPLRTLDTTTTIVRNIEAMEASYDKMASVLYGHRSSLQSAATRLAAFNWSPASNSQYTPVLSTSGGNNGFGKRRLLFEDVLRLFTRFNEADIPDEGRVLVLSPQHESDLMLQDLAMYKALMNTSSLFGFKVFRTSACPKFNGSGVKLPFGATVTSGYAAASFAYHKDEVVKAMGTVEMFSKLRDPDQKGDAFNFQMRYMALPLRNKAIGTIYSADASAPVVVPYISLSPSTLDAFAKEGGVRSIVVNASGAWTVANDDAADTWLSAVKDGDTVRVTVAANSEEDAPARDGSITVNVTGTSASASVAIAQDANPAS